MHIDRINRYCHYIIIYRRERNNGIIITLPQTRQLAVRGGWANF